MNNRLMQLIFSLFLIVGSIVIGRTVLAITQNKTERTKHLTQKAIFTLRNIAFYSLSPFIVVNAFWLIEFKSISVISVPFIGLGALMLGSALSVLFSKALKHERKQQGAMFCAGSCSNIGTIGSFLCFVFFGEMGIVLSALYKIFEVPYYVLFLYPTAKTYSDEQSGLKENRLLSLVKNPIVVVYFFSIVLGLILNFTHITRPAILSKLTSIVIPLTSFMLIVAIGYTMRFSKVSTYKKEVLGISAIKYILTPLFVIGVSLLLGLNHVGDGTLFKILIVLSALPSGFNALISAQMFHLDINLANACWIVTTGLLIPVIAIIWLFVL